MNKSFSGLKALFLIISCGAFLIMGISGTGLAEDAKKDQSKEAKQGQPTQAKQPDTSSGKMDSGQKLQEMQKKSQELRKKLGKIRKKALEENPELKKKEDELRSLVQKKMKENMADKDVDKKRMDEIRKEIRENPDMESSRKKALIKEYQTNARVYQKAQRKTMQDSEVKNKRNEFQQELIAAMKEVDPNTQSLMEKMQNIRQKLRRVKMQNMRKMKKRQKQK